MTIGNKIVVTENHATQTTSFIPLSTEYRAWFADGVGSAYSIGGLYFRTYDVYTTDLDGKLSISGFGDDVVYIDQKGELAIANDDEPSFIMITNGKLEEGTMDYIHAEATAYTPAKLKKVSTTK